MARYIDEEHLMEKVSRMIDYCEKNKDKKFNALDILFQVGDAIMDCPTLGVAPRADVAREIFEEIKKQQYTILDWHDVVDMDEVAEIIKKYTEDTK